MTIADEERQHLAELKRQQEWQIEQHRDDARRASRQAAGIIDDIEDATRSCLHAFDADLDQYQTATHMFASIRDDIDTAVNQRMRELEHSEEDAHERYRRRLSSAENGQ